jgi:2-iminobutanoate/2-iminopropanoate deaminase
MSSDRRVFATTNAPAAIGPYSQAIGSAPFVYTAGQLGVDPESGQLVAGSVAAQTRQALRNLAYVLEAAGSRLELVLKTTVFLTDMTDFHEMNEVYATVFAADPPARSTVAVAALPMNARVEIEAVARMEEPSGDG